MKTNSPSNLNTVWISPSCPDQDTLLKAVAVLFRRQMPRQELSTIADLTLSDTELSCERIEK